MTNQERRICTLRQEGYAQIAIAGILGITISRVRYVCSLYEVKCPERLHQIRPSARRSSTGLMSRIIHDSEYEFDEFIGRE